MLRPGRHKHNSDKTRKGSSSKHSENASDSELAENSAAPPSGQKSLRLGHSQVENSQKPTRSSPLPWNRAVPTHRREKATEGLLMGCAIAEALSLARNDLHPRIALKLFGRNPLQYQFEPGVGTASHRTHLMLMTFQAILQSKTDPKILTSNLKRRIAWYQRSFLFRHLLTHLKRFRVSRVNSVFDNSMTVALADDPLIRSLVMSVMLQGVVDSASTWFQMSVGISHADSRVLHASTLVGYAGQLAQMTPQDEFDPHSILDVLIDYTDEPTLDALLLEARDALSKKQTVGTLAKRLGWYRGIPNSVYAAAIIGIYAWLRHPKRFRICVERTILLGGACSNAAVIAGALSGISLGRQAMPKEWLRKISMRPHSNHWLETLIERVKDWPHGVEDIHNTRALPSMIFGQLVRNLSYSAFRTLHGLIRFPMKMMQFSIEKRVPKSKSGRVPNYVARSNPSISG